MSDRNRDLAEAILRVLGAQRLLGRGSYPLSLKRLGDLAEVEERFELNRAARTEVFRDGAVLAKPGDVNAPVAFWEDVDVLAGDAQLLRYLLERADTDHNQVHSIPELSRWITSARDEVLRIAFKTSLANRIDADDLPEGVGALIVRNKPRLFLLQRIRKRPDAAATAPAPPDGSPGGNGTGASAPPANSTAVQRPRAPAKSDFEGDFWRTFHRLDLEGGRRNFVSLSKLRQELNGYDRNTFDSWIREMRNHTQISLAATHGGRRLSAEEREAGIREAGRLLVYVSKRKR